MCGWIDNLVASVYPDVRIFEKAVDLVTGALIGADARSRCVVHRTARGRVPRSLVGVKGAGG